MSAALPPHPWDDDEHRRRIHEAFDRWFVAYELRHRGCGRQAAHLATVLRRLCADAWLRRATMIDRTGDPEGVA